jgi:uracil-DNA glycosylase family 4
MNASSEHAHQLDQLRAYVDYLRDLGIYDLYRREDPSVLLPESLRESFVAQQRSASQPPMPTTATARVPSVQRPPSAPTPARTATPGPSATRPQAPSALSNYVSSGVMEAPLPPEFAASMPKPKSFDEIFPLPSIVIPASERQAALEAVRANIGDCTRCPLAYAGRSHIVFADGDPSARLMFVGEGPGADEDASGLPFVGKAGQLLNNMIAAMGLQREQVYIANIVKCRPPANRTPEFIEATTCSQFLIQQIDIVRPQVIVALGATAATYLLGVKQSLASLRGSWHSSRGAKVTVTYHPAFLLRDPRQKGEAWKDLQRVMVELGLKAPAKPSANA